MMGKGEFIFMKKKTIFSIAYSSPMEDDEYYGFGSKISLLDADIVVFNPDITGFISESYEKLNGKPLLSENDSFLLRDQIKFWQTEIKDALYAGKTVFIILNAKQECYADSGKREYSGTGRNQVQTVKNSLIVNYNSIPLKLEPVNTKGFSIKLGLGGNLVKAYWSDLENISEYRVKLEVDYQNPLFTTKNGNKTVGLHLRTKESGNLVLLPFINFEKSEFYTYNDDDEYVWNSKAITLGKKLQSHLIEIDRALRLESNLSPAPSWTNKKHFELKREIEARSKMFKLDDEITILTDKRDVIRDEIKKISNYKRLLYENGKPLEAIILDSLKLIGFKAENYKDSSSEFDVIFESKEGRFLGEVEGKDRKAINIEKFRQLALNIHEDFEREGVDERAHGVLFGNAFRLIEPEKRSEFFTKKCLTSARSTGAALVRTTDLFEVVKYLESKKDIRFATKCRKAILNTHGDIVEFPKPPVEIVDKKDIIKAQPRDEK